MESGSDRPRKAADLCKGLAMLIALVGFVAMLAIGGQSHGANTDPLLSNVPASNQWPIGIAALFASLIVSFSWYLASVVLDWLAARYEQSETLKEGGHVKSA